MWTTLEIRYVTFRVLSMVWIKVHLTVFMSYGYLIFNYNVFIHLNHVHVLLMFLFIGTEINQIKSNS